MSTTRCDAVREDLSARLDGEHTDLPPDRLDAHLLSCAACGEWLDRVEKVTRQVRLHRSGAPDLTAPILAAVSAQRMAGREAALGVRQVLRVAVGVAAAVQLLLALPVLFGVGADPHASREMASFDIAVAVGFALAAWRPERARAFVPVAFVLAGCLAATSVLDIAEGTTPLAHEVGHLAALAQALLLWALSRRTKGDPGVASVGVSGHAAS